MAFNPGDEVIVELFGRGTVREARNGRYVVEVKGRPMVVEAARLTPAAPRKGSTPAAASRGGRDQDPPGRAHAAAEIDLHGRTAAEAGEALEIFLSDAILAGHAAVRVIHGRSGGRVKNEVHARLTRLSAVRGFRIDPANAGVTIVTL
ncbi:MAG: Smr/MutS family protein [Acidobacteriota bacterium]|nr:Smr/MutS family protein [Acidobacteriota bacterium]